MQYTVKFTQFNLQLKAIPTLDRALWHPSSSLLYPQVLSVFQQIPLLHASPQTEAAASSQMVRTISQGFRGSPVYYRRVLGVDIEVIKRLALVLIHPKEH